MYSTRERERRKILAQGCEKLTHGLGVFEQEVYNSRRYSIIFKLHGKKRYNAKKIKDEGESHCCYHSKACTQVVSTVCLFEILGNHYFYTVLEKSVSNKGILKA